jgi:hypothetical protein
MNDEATVTFDSKHELRIYDSDKFNASVQLAEKSGEFVNSMFILISI